MLKRFILLKRFVKSILNETDLDDLIFSNHDWQVLAEIVEVLTEFNEATELMIGETYPTLSMVYPLFSRLHKSVKAKRETLKCDEAQDMCDQIATALTERWIVTIEPEHLIACYLDPRFKTLNFIEDRPLRRCVKTLVREKLKELGTGGKVSAAADPGEGKTSKKSSLFESLFIAEPLPKSDEVSNYDDMPNADKDTKVLAWWKKHE